MLLTHKYEYLLHEPFFKEGLNKLSIADFDNFSTRNGDNHFIKTIMFIELRVPFCAYGTVYIQNENPLNVLWTIQGRCFGENNVHLERFDLIPTITSIN